MLISHLAGEATGTVALRMLADRMIRDTTGKEILQRKPVINRDTVDFTWLRSLPANTFGRSYVE